MPIRQPVATNDTLKALGRGCALTAAVLLGLFVLASLATYLLFQQPGSEVKVPNLVGMQANDAQAAAERVGLSARVAGWRYDDNYPSGAVCATEPPPGRTVRAGRGLHLFVSKGPRNAGVPDLSGKTLAEARELLQKRGLVVGEVWNRRSDEDKGVVISQSAAPSSKVSAGTVIDLEVSGGPDYGVIHVDGAPDRLFRTVVVRIPDDGQQHHVLVKLDHGGAEQVVHDRIYAPRDRAEIEVAGESGDNILALMDDRTILTSRLQ